MCGMANNDREIERKYLLRALPKRVKGARALDPKHAGPWLLITEICFTARGEPVVFARDYHRGDSFSFNFSHNIVKGIVVDALLWGEPCALTLNDLLTGIPPEAAGSSKERLAKTAWLSDSARWGRSLPNRSFRLVFQWLYFCKSFSCPFSAASPTTPT